jgi:uncharacterized protein with von Willebrand factor type A (vWA) domain
MLINFFFTLREHRVPTTIRELLDLLEALEKGIAYASIDEFYLLSRAVLVKDEKHFDKFDKAFAKYFEGVESIDPDLLTKAIPEDWLRREIEKNLSPEELAEMQKTGSLEKLMEQLRQRLEEQHTRHQAATAWWGRAEPLRSGAMAPILKAYA